MEFNELKSPKYYKELISSDTFKKDIENYRTIVKDIVNGRSNKLLLIVGPCSIHNYDEFIDYLDLFNKIKNKYESKIFFMIRMYIEKSRSTGLWKGYLNDPNLDNTCNIELGIKNTRQLFLEATKRNIPIATEILCPLTCKYLDDFVTWSAIGARTCENQITRIIASEFDYPIGFKNDRKGDIQIPIDGINQSKKSHNYVSINTEGSPCIIKTIGNNNNHIILRGAIGKVNYKEEDVKAAKDLLLKHNIDTKIIIDCSHDNCMRYLDSKNCYKNQELVVDDVIRQKHNKDEHICGLMIESNINEGSQSIDCENKKYGISITDPCISIQETDRIINKLFNSI